MPGLTFSSISSSGLRVRALPKGTIFSIKGPSILARDEDQRWSLMELLNTGEVSFLLSTLSVNRSAELNYVSRISIPKVWEDHFSGQSAQKLYRWLRWTSTGNETSRYFVGAPLSRPLHNHILDLSTADALIRDLRRRASNAFAGFALPDEEVSAFSISAEEFIGIGQPDETLWIEFLLGCALGRWSPIIQDVVAAEQALPDAFQSMPVPPVTHIGEENRQLETLGPLVLVDDRGHANDILEHLTVARIELVHKQDIEGVPVIEDSIRNVLRGQLFANHIKHYSVARRRAPIYWQLATSSVSYSVWLYYHRFTKDTFYKVLNDYVTPKLRHEERKLAGLMQTASANSTASQRKEIAAQEAFVEELRAFREEIARIAPLWNPDLNDGVIINFAPLWRLVPHHRAWQKECKSCWDKLVAGDYDWAHLAMHLWPERVVPKCAEDRSLAIAHGLEDVFWIEGSNGKWQPRKVDLATIDQLIKERTSAAVKDALKSLLEAPAPMTKRSTTRAKGTRRKSSPRTSRLAATNGPDPSMLAQGKAADGSITKTDEPRGDRDDIAGEAHA